MLLLFTVSYYCDYSFIAVYLLRDTLVQFSLLATNCRYKQPGSLFLLCFDTPWLIKAFF